MRTFGERKGEGAMDSVIRAGIVLEVVMTMFLIFQDDNVVLSRLSTWSYIHAQTKISNSADATFIH
jgi:hypothetical protein